MCGVLALFVLLCRVPPTEVGVVRESLDASIKTTLVVKVWGRVCVPRGRKKERREDFVGWLWFGRVEWGTGWWWWCYVVSACGDVAPGG